MKKVLLGILMMFSVVIYCQQVATYNPLVGITSITDPRGETLYYTYDAFNRLEHVKDAEGNILNKNEYNYKN